jgi:hypothetical protein
MTGIERKRSSLGLVYGIRTGGPFILGPRSLSLIEKFLLSPYGRDSMGTKMTVKPFRVRGRSTRLENLDA